MILIKNRARLIHIHFPREVYAILQCAGNIVSRHQRNERIGILTDSQAYGSDKPKSDSAIRLGMPCSTESTHWVSGHSDIAGIEGAY